MRLTLVNFLFLSQIGAFLINYLADVLPETGSLSRPIWWPLNRKSLIKYFSIARIQIVQIAFLWLSFWLWNNPVLVWNLLSLLIIVLYFGLVIIIDIEHRAILHPLSIAGVIIFIIIKSGGNGYVNSIIGGLAGFAILFSIYLLGNQLAQWMAKRRDEDLNDDAMGFGDVILAGVIGILLGWPGVVAGLFLGLFAAGIYSAIHILWQLVRGKYQVFSSIPLGPFISLGALAAILLNAYA